MAKGGNGREAVAMRYHRPHAGASSSTPDTQTATNIGEYQGSLSKPKGPEERNG